MSLEKITSEQFDASALRMNSPSIKAIDVRPPKKIEKKQHFIWGIGPYFAHRLFNPDLPLSMELGVELEAGYQITNELKILGSIRKSIFTNLTDNNRRSNSVLPRVHSEWPLYDIAGQSGHIHELAISYVKNLAPGLYTRAHAGLLEPFFAGVGAEILYKPAQWPLGIGLDIHRVRKRNYDMQFDLRLKLMCISLYYDAGGMFDIEVVPGDTLRVRADKISQSLEGLKLGLRDTIDVPFDTFGEGHLTKRST